MPDQPQNQPPQQPCLGVWLGRNQAMELMFDLHRHLSDKKSQSFLIWADPGGDPDRLPSDICYGAVTGLASFPDSPDVASGKMGYGPPPDLPSNPSWN